MIDKQCTITFRGEPDGVFRVRVAGEIDMAVRGEVEEAILSALQNPDTVRVLVDIDEVTFLDSSGITALVVGQHAAQRAGRAYQVVNPQPGVRRVLEIACVLEMLTEES
jgi:anti-sigma B factor antagonist